MRRGLPVLLAGAALLAACGRPAEQQDAAPGASALSAPDETPAAPLSPASAAPVRPALLAAGQKSYAVHCAGCHGEVAEGDFGPPLAGAAAGDLTDFDLADFSRAVREGWTARGELLSSMPRLTSSLLPDTALEGIHTYLRSLE